jgi:hypothetical protein
VRIRVIHTFSIPSIDGIQLQHYELGRTYEVGVTIGSLLLAEGWAEPTDDEDEPTRPVNVVHDPPRFIRDIAADYARTRKR